MTWAYRMLRVNAHLPYVIIIEVYATDGVIDSWTDTPVYAVGDNVADLKEDMALMALALEKPLLEEVGGKLVEVSDE